MKHLPRLHFWVGVAGVLAFLATGQYMHHALNHLDGMADGPRLLFRSAHIYLLLTAILNLVMGIYLPSAVSRVRPFLQYIVSAVILLSPWIMLAGFFIGSRENTLARPMIQLGLYALFAVAVALTVQSFWRRK